MTPLEEAFCEAEEKAMRFLVADYGFRRTERKTYPETTAFVGGLASYRSESTRPHCAPAGWTVTLSYAPARLECGLDISDGSAKVFSVQELNGIAGRAPFPARLHDLYGSIHDAEAQFAEFDRLAGILRTSGARFFAGDVGLWSELQEQRNRLRQEDEDRHAIADSESAFRSKDWRKVVLLLGQRSERLSMATAARLSFARKRLQGDA